MEFNSASVNSFEHRGHVTTDTYPTATTKHQQPSMAVSWQFATPHRRDCRWSSGMLRESGVPS